MNGVCGAHKNGTIEISLRKVKDSQLCIVATYTITALLKTKCIHIHLRSKKWCILKLKIFIIKF